MMIKSGLDEIFQFIQTLPTPLSSHTQTSRAQIQKSIQKLDVFLLDSFNEISEKVLCIQNVEIGKRVFMNGAFKFLDSYKLLYDTITDPINEYEDVDSLIPRTVFEVETLLSFDE